MPHYYTYRESGSGVVLVHSDGFKFCPSRVDAEQTLLSNINCWAMECPQKAAEEMELLTRLIRS